VKIKLDRTMCDGFGKCAEHAPAIFSLDEWGYASYASGVSAHEELPDGYEQPARRALLDCPVHAIIERREQYREHSEPQPPA
jgi:ferredoxin